MIYLASRSATRTRKSAGGGMVVAQYTAFLLEGGAHVYSPICPL